MKTRGFTLLEVIIYIGLFSILMGGGIVATYQLLEGGARNTAAVSIQQEGTFLNRKINWELTGAKDASVSGTTLTITPGDVVFDSTGGMMTISRNGSAPVRLSSESFAVENVIFDVVDTPDKPTMVSVSFSIEGRPFFFNRYIR